MMLGCFSYLLPFICLFFLLSKPYLRKKKEIYSIEYSRARGTDPDASRCGIIPIGWSIQKSQKDDKAGAKRYQSTWF